MSVHGTTLGDKLTHAFVRAMTRAKVPCWMNEGIAQVIDGSHNNEERPLGSYPTVESLRKSFVKETDAATVKKLYWFSKRMVEELLWRDGGGPEAFRKFAKCLQDLRELGMDGSLKKHYGMTAQELLESVK